MRFWRRKQKPYKSPSDFGIPDDAAVQFSNALRAAGRDLLDALPADLNIDITVSTLRSRETVFRWVGGRTST